MAELTHNPQQGTPLGHDFYKLRLAISGTGKGKSGGARIITYLILDEQKVLLVEIYLKSEYSTADVSALIARLKSQGLL